MLTGESGHASSQSGEQSYPSLRGGPIARTASSITTPYFTEGAVDWDREGLCDIVIVLDSGTYIVPVDVSYNTEMELPVNMFVLQCVCCMDCKEGANVNFCWMHTPRRHIPDIDGPYYRTTE